MECLYSSLTRREVPKEQAAVKAATDGPPTLPILACWLSVASEVRLTTKLFNQESSPAKTLYSTFALTKKKLLNLAQYKTMQTPHNSIWHSEFCTCEEAWNTKMSAFLQDLSS